MDKQLLTLNILLQMKVKKIWTRKGTMKIKEKGKEKRTDGQQQSEER